MSLKRSTEIRLRWGLRFRAAVVGIAALNLFVGGSTLQAQTDGPLECRLEVDAESYAIGDSLSLSLVLQNRSDRPLTLFARWYEIATALELSGRQGDPLGRRPFRELMVAAPAPSDLREVSPNEHWRLRLQGEILPAAGEGPSKGLIDFGVSTVFLATAPDRVTASLSYEPGHWLAGPLRDQAWSGEIACVAATFDLVT